MAEKPSDLEKKVQDLIIQDPVHGAIMLDPLCVKIINTPQFQRLRRIKQLGSTYFVYPGASHNRFEHSIGVCYLAGRFVEILRVNQPDLDIKPEDVLCVKIAGLCHDLGHGPFSHLFETIVKELRGGQREWKHEKASLDMFDHLMTENGLDGELDEKDKTFIKRLIHHDPKEDSAIRHEETGRFANKEFLYQIVANETNGIDVDKWDYFARDCHMLGIKNNFDHQRCMQLARVYDVRQYDVPQHDVPQHDVPQPKGDKTKKEICFRNKEKFNLEEMFYTRYTLHKRAYRHKTAIIIDAMIIDVIKEADEHYKTISERNLSISESVDTIKAIEAFTSMTDDVLYEIGRSTNSKLQTARHIYERILKRDLYKLICKKTIQALDKDLLQKTTVDTVKDGLMNVQQALRREEFIIKIAKFDYGKGKDNPLDSVNFFDKDFKLIEKTGNDTMTSNRPICEWDILVIYKGKDNGQMEMIQQAFETWFKEFSKPMPAKE